MTSCTGFAVVVTTSRSAAVAVGSTVSFTCKTDSTLPIVWTLYQHQLETYVTLHNGDRIHPNYADRFLVSYDKLEDVTLLLNDVQMSDAGQYICRERGSVRNSKTFTLVVLGMYLISHA